MKLLVKYFKIKSQIEDYIVLIRPFILTQFLKLAFIKMESSLKMLSYIILNILLWKLKKKKVKDLISISICYYNNINISLFSPFFKCKQCLKCLHARYTPIKYIKFSYSNLEPQIYKKNTR